MKVTKQRGRKGLDAPSVSVELSNGNIVKVIDNNSVWFIPKVGKIRQMVVE